MEHTSRAMKQYLDASAEVFMEEYAVLLENGIEEEAAHIQAEFPEELDKRCQKLLRVSRKQHKHVRPQHVLRYAAAVLLFLVGTFSVLFYSVEAFRLPIMNFFIDKSEKFWILSTNRDIVDTSLVFNEADPLGEILPDDFYIVNHSGSWDDGMFVVEYSNGDVCKILFIMSTKDAQSLLNTEDAKVTQFSLEGHDAVLTVNNENVILAWLDETVPASFTLTSQHIDKNAVLDIAERIIEMFV